MTTENINPALQPLARPIEIRFFRSGVRAAPCPGAKAPTALPATPNPAKPYDREPGRPAPRAKAP